MSERLRWHVSVMRAEVPGGELTVRRIADRDWRWAVTRNGQEVAEGQARDMQAARFDAEAAAFGDAPA